MIQVKAKHTRITIDLSAFEAERLDPWIATHPQPRPSRADAIRKLLNLGLLHGNEVAYLVEQIAQTDHDIREKFDQVFGMMDRITEWEPLEKPPAKKPN